MKTTGGDISWLNVHNEIHNRIIHNMVRVVIIDSNQHVKNGSVKQKHQQKSIYARSIVN